MLKPATVMFVNARVWGGPLTVNVDGEGDTPHPLYVTAVLKSVTPVGTPEGKVSVKLTLEIALGPGLLIVNVSAELPPGLMVLGENALTRLALMILA